MDYRFENGRRYHAYKEGSEFRSLDHQLVYARRNSCLHTDTFCDDQLTLYLMMRYALCVSIHSRVPADLDLQPELERLGIFTSCTPRSELFLTLPPISKAKSISPSTSDSRFPQTSNTTSGAFPSTALSTSPPFPHPPTLSSTSAPAPESGPSNSPRKTPPRPSQESTSHPSNPAGSRPTANSKSTTSKPNGPTHSYPPNPTWNPTAATETEASTSSTAAC